MIWYLFPLAWVLASITIGLGFNGFLKAERAYQAMLDRASDRARQRVEREMRPQAEKDAEAATWALQASGQARAMQDASRNTVGLFYSQQNALGQCSNNLGMLGGGYQPYNGMFGFGGVFR